MKPPCAERLQDCRVHKMQTPDRKAALGNESEEDKDGVGGEDEGGSTTSRQAPTNLITLGWLPVIAHKHMQGDTG